MYLWARQWGIQPSEFWEMTISEWWLEYDLNAPSDPKEKYAGKLTRAEVEELKEYMRNGSSKRN
jgi:hypothetical protein